MASGQEKEAATTSTTTSSSTGESPPTQTRMEGTTATTATGTSPGHESDGEFEPSAEMLVNEFDDEHTLDEEEEMAEDGDNADEIDDLQREGEMPLEELLAMYGYHQTATTSTDPTNAGGGSSSSQGSESTPDASSIGHVATGDVLGTPVASEDTTGTSDDGGSWVQTAVIGDDEEDDDDDEDYEEYDYSDFDEASNEGRRTTDNKVGEQWQAEVPEGLCPYDDVPAYENQDTLLWDPKDLTDDVIEQYLVAVTGDHQPTNDHQHNQLPSSVTSNHSTSSSGDSRDRPSPLHSFPVADDEQALLLLLQCGHKVDEAIRRLRVSPKSSPSNSSIFETMTQWSGQEMEDFEEGLRLFGKDFHAIQRNKVHSRSVQEIVHFYYMWKKTERHDVFVARHRVEKKNYALHPTTTDYMDRFMEEFEATPSPASSVTSSGSSLIVGKSTTVGLNNNNPSNKFSSVDGTPTGNVIVNGIPRNSTHVTSTVGGDHHPIVSIPDITSHHVNTHHHHNHPSHHHQHISHHSYPHHLHPSFNVHSQQQQPSKPVDIDRQEDPISIEVPKSTTPTDLDIIAVEEVVGVTGETIVSLVHDE